VIHRWQLKLSVLWLDDSRLQFSFYGPSTAVLMYNLSWRMSRDNNDLLWWAIVGYTEQFLLLKSQVRFGRGAQDNLVDLGWVFSSELGHFCYPGVLMNVASSRAEDLALVWSCQLKFARDLVKGMLYMICPRCWRGKVADLGNSGSKVQRFESRNCCWHPLLWFVSRFP